MKKIALSLALCSVALFAGKNVVVADVPPVDVPAQKTIANDVSNGVALKLGTLGVGVDYEHFFTDKFAVRLNVNGLTYTKNKTIKGIPFHAKLTLLTAGILADYHPTGNSFRISGGLYYNGNKLDINAKTTASKSLTVNGTTYTNTAKVSVNGKIDFQKADPYVGVGWSSTELQGWHFTADLGVMYHGTPKVHLTGKSNLTGAAKNKFNSDVENERVKIYNEAKDYKFYPVISIGIEKKF